MKRFFLTAMISLCVILNTRAQSKPAAEKLNAAQALFNKGKYEDALIRLKGTGKTSPAILHLTIITQRALLPDVNDPRFYNDIKQFDKLEELRDNCRIFLASYQKSGVSRYKLKEVQDVQQSLKPFPVAKVQFDEMMHLHKSSKHP